MVMNNICFLLNSFLHCSAYENVVFCWVMHEQSIMDTILGRLDVKNCAVKKIALVADEESLRRRLAGDIRRGLRTDDVIERSVARIPMYEVLDAVRIDTSYRSVPEIVKEIMAL